MIKQSWMGSIKALLGIAFWSASATLAYAGGICSAGSLAQLKSCLTNLSTYDSVSLTSDIVCGTGECCPSGSSPTLWITNQSNKIIEGNGRKIIRYANQKSCPALRVNYSNNLTIRNLTIDEWSTTSCTLDDARKADQCLTTYILDSNNVSLDNVEVRTAPGIAVKIYHVDGFELKNSRILDSGIEGFYAGDATSNPSSPAPSRRVKITNSSFLNTGVSAISLEGVDGTQLGDNAIIGNTILGNHWNGIFPNTITQQISDGGQLYIGLAKYLLVQGNQIGSGYCYTCQNHVVNGIEFGYGDPNKTIANPIQHVLVSNNRIFNHHGAPIHVNTGTNLAENQNAILDLVVDGNTMINNDINDDAYNSKFLTIKTNKTLAPRLVVDFENTTDWPNGWNSWQLCSTGAQAQRICYGAGEAYGSGSCALRLSTSSMSCNDGWQGLWVQGMGRPVGPGVTVYMTSWSRNGSSAGRACLVFANSSLVEIGNTCAFLSQEKTWRYNGDPLVQAVTPANTAYVYVRFAANTANAAVDIDKIQVAW